MNILFLPGIAQKTEAWAEKLMQELAFTHCQLTIQRYDHWDSEGEGCMQLEREIDKLHGAAQVDLVLAKSIGVVVALMAINRGVIRPAKVVLIGTPVLSCAEENVDLQSLAGDLAIPALYIQQKDDVVGSSGALCAEVGKAALATVIEVPGNNHQYKDLKLLCRHIHRWLEI